MKGCKAWAKRHTLVIMKNNTTTLHDRSHSNDQAVQDNVFPAGLVVWKVGLDIELRAVAVAMQYGRGAIGLAAKWTREQLIQWVKQKSARGEAVYTVYESCGFGYTLHEQLCAAGAHSLVTTPMRLNLERRRKNDRMDARELCVRLSRYLDGQLEEMRPIRIPSRAEQQRRELGRQREFWKREVRRLENHGRALRIEHEHETLEAGWAGPRKWKRLAPQCSEFVREQLTPVMEQIRAAKAQLERLSQQIQALVQKEQIPTGLGALTVSLIDGEVCEWKRFLSRKAVSSYTGCCPSEHSSGPVQRFGAIDRHGNKHLRVLLVEAVWRLLKWQPRWHARQKYLMKLRHGARKKIAVALARQLAIDLWRWRTGRTSAAELGWTLPAASVHQPKQVLEFTNVNLPRQTVPQGGTLLDAAADPTGSSLRMGAFHPKALPQVQARHRGRPNALRAARIGAGDRETRSLQREAASCGAHSPLGKSKERKMKT
jgi:transposase